MPTISRNMPEQVAQFYDEHTAAYIEAGEDIIQSLRPDDRREFLEYLAGGIGITDGLRILDAGCGLAGPAMYFANCHDVYLDCLTISAVECAAATSRVMDAGLSAKIAVRQGDYHTLEKLYPAASFDAVIFLESLGHAADPDRVLQATSHVLKRGGSVYIKDFFLRHTVDATEQTTFRSIVESIDRNYCYNTPALAGLLSMLARAQLQVLSVSAPTFVPSRTYLDSFAQLFACASESSPIDWLEIKCVK